MRFFYARALLLLVSLSFFSSCLATDDDSSYTQVKYENCRVLETLAKETDFPTTFEMEFIRLESLTVFSEGHKCTLNPSALRALRNYSDEQNLESKFSSIKPRSISKMDLASFRSLELYILLAYWNGVISLDDNNIDVALMSLSKLYDAIQHDYAHSPYSFNASHTPDSKELMKAYRASSFYALSLIAKMTTESDVSEFNLEIASALEQRLRADVVRLMTGQTQNEPLPKFSDTIDDAKLIDLLNSLRDLSVRTVYMTYSPSASAEIFEETMRLDKIAAKNILIMAEKLPASQRYICNSLSEYYHTAAKEKHCQ